MPRRTMPGRMRHRKQGGAFVVFAFLTAASVAAAAAESPRPTMRAVFAEMKVLIPLSLDADRWSAPASRKKILASLHRLEFAASALQDHGLEHEVGFEEIAVHLGSDLNDAYEYYRLGAFEEARFFLTGSLQNCVACHVRLPSDRAFPLADELMNRIEVDALAPREKAWLLVIVRRFEDALGTWEGLIQDPRKPAARLDASGVLADYLDVAIRVRGATARASATLEKFGKRKDLPFYLEQRIREWRKDLAHLDSKPFSISGAPSLEAGIALATKSGEIPNGFYGRDGLIHDLAAASQFTRWLERDRKERLEKTRNRTTEERRNTALAYYWLGIVEARSLDGFWVNLSERHLEAAVRSDPKGPLARKAYALLEETEVLGYGGSSGADLPIDVWNMLKELRELMGETR